MFILTDGRRYKCSGPAFSGSNPAPSRLDHAAGCVALSRLVVPAASRAVFTALATVRTCLAMKALRVRGGPVFPQQSPSSPDGELIVGNGNGGAFIAFYTDATRAARLEPAVRQNARRFGGRVDRRGAVTVVWIHPPPAGLRTAVLTCAFR